MRWIGACLEWGCCRSPAARPRSSAALRAGPTPEIGYLPQRRSFEADTRIPSLPPSFAVVALAAAFFALAALRNRLRQLAPRHREPASDLSRIEA
jgi:hypothetical protein